MFLLNLVVSLFRKVANQVGNLDELLDRTIEGAFSYRVGRRKSIPLEGPQDLEVRITPANTALWVGPAGGLWSNKADWSINGQQGVPQNGDNLQFGGSIGGVKGALTNSTDDIGDLNIGNLTINLANDPNVFAQTITINQTFGVTGNVSIANGTPGSMTIAGTSALNVPMKTSSFNWGGGTISVPLNFGMAGMGGGTMTISGSDITINNTFTNYGTVNWKSANPQQQPGPNINFGNALGASIQNNGTFNILTASTEQIIGHGSITNAGIMQKTGANTTAVNLDSFVNAGGGTLTINSGTLAFGTAQGFQNPILINSNGTTILNGGNLSSSGLIRINGGLVEGVGNITGNVSNAGGTVSPGVSNVPGTLTITGDYTQGSGGTLVINIDAIGNIGLLNVTQSATLNGTLNVNKNISYTPPLGTDLVFMNYASLTGVFATVNITNNLWGDPNGQGPVEFIAQPNPATKTYDLDTQNI